MWKPMKGGLMPAVCAPQAEAGKIRPLAMSSAGRHPAYPHVPTLREPGEQPQYLDSAAFAQFLEQDDRKVGAILRQITKR
jgi:tripartite-type tricarboxylate transporter receptor subunit TctC